MQLFNRTQRYYLWRYCYFRDQRYKLRLRQLRRYFLLRHQQRLPLNSQLLHLPAVHQYCRPHLNPQHLLPYLRAQGHPPLSTTTIFISSQSTILSASTASPTAQASQPLSKGAEIAIAVSGSALITIILGLLFQLRRQRRILRTRQALPPDQILGDSNVRNTGTRAGVRELDDTGLRELYDTGLQRELGDTGLRELGDTGRREMSDVSVREELAVIRLRSDLAS